MLRKNLPHIILPNPPEKYKYINPIKLPGGGQQTPQRDRKTHAEHLIRSFDRAWQIARDEQVVYHTTRDGVYLEFKSSPGYELITKSLEDLRTKKVRLCNVRKRDIPTKVDEENKPVIYATVYISNDSREFFLKKLNDYAEKDHTTGTPKNLKVVNSISDILNASLIKSFWVSEEHLIPNESPLWCEVWLRVDSDTKEEIENVINNFEDLLTAKDVTSKSGYLLFPERVVKLVHVNGKQLEILTRYCDYIAEYRIAKDTASFWVGMQTREQTEWVENLTERLQINKESLVSICLLDTGVNYGHPLLAPVFEQSDCHSCNVLWGVYDHDKHGTLMAGILVYGNLDEQLSSSGQVFINHKIESVKILPPKGENSIELWGLITSQGVSLPIIKAPERTRIYCMAVTADKSEMGRPTSWSGALDRIIAGIDDEIPKLIVVAAGNTDIESNISYPDNLIESSVQDPGQSWNALTVGSYTQLTQITDQTYKNYKPVAGVGELSPFSTTSRSWDKRWPIKPDIVMEGGNLAISEDKRPEECDDLSLVSTYFKPEKTLFWPFGMTSSSSALASHFAAQIQIEHPEYWPETIRALMVNSAQWPENLKNQFVNKENKTEYGKLLRTCGYGVPVLKDALYSSNNSLTLISQAEIQPFEKKGSATKTKDFHLYELPWPKEVLYGFQNLDMEMKVTLSYFIEPGPGEIGWNNRYRYPSHQLRFDIKTPFESKEEFLKKVSKAQREEGEVMDSKSTTSEFWTIGTKNQNKGSLHSDIWKCTAAQLAECCYLAVFPVTGWWKERDYLGKANTKTRYSLVLTIKTPVQKIDIYTPIIQKIGITIPI